MVSIVLCTYGSTGISTLDVESNISSGDVSAVVLAVVETTSVDTIMLGISIAVRRNCMFAVKHAL